MMNASTSAMSPSPMQDPVITGAPITVADGASPTMPSADAPPPTQLPPPLPPSPPTSASAPLATPGDGSLTSPPSQSIAPASSTPHATASLSPDDRAAAPPEATSIAPSPSAASETPSHAATLPAEWMLVFGMANVNQAFISRATVPDDVTSGPIRDAARLTQLVAEHPTMQVVTFNKDVPPSDCAPHAHVQGTWTKRGIEALVKEQPQLVGRCRVIVVDYFRFPSAYGADAYGSLFKAGAIAALVATGIFDERTRVIVPHYAEFETDFAALRGQIAGATIEQVPLAAKEHPLYTATEALEQTVRAGNAPDVFGAFVNEKQLLDPSNPFRLLTLRVTTSATALSDAADPSAAPLSDSLPAPPAPHTTLDNVWNNPRLVAPKGTGQISSHTPVLQSPVSSSSSPSTSRLLDDAALDDVDPDELAASHSLRLDTPSGVLSPLAAAKDRSTGAPTVMPGDISSDLLRPLRFVRTLVRNLVPPAFMRADAPGLILTDTSGTTLPQYERPLSLVWLTVDSSAQPQKKKGSSGGDASERLHSSLLLPHWILSSYNDNECLLRSLMLADVRTTAHLDASPSIPQEKRDKIESDHLSDVAMLRQLQRDPYTGLATQSPVSTDPRIGSSESAQQVELNLIHRFRERLAAAAQRLKRKDSEQLREPATIIDLSDHGDLIAEFLQCTIRAARVPQPISTQWCCDHNLPSGIVNVPDGHSWHPTQGPTDNDSVITVLAFNNATPQSNNTAGHNEPLIPAPHWLDIGATNPLFTGRLTQWWPFAPIAGSNNLFMIPFYDGPINFDWTFMQYIRSPSSSASSATSLRSWSDMTQAHIRIGSVVEYNDSAPGTLLQGVVLLTYVRLSTTAINTVCVHAAKAAGREEELIGVSPSALPTCCLLIWPLDSDPDDEPTAGGCFTVLRDVSCYGNLVEQLAVSNVIRVVDSTSAWKPDPALAQKRSHAVDTCIIEKQQHLTMHDIVVAPTELDKMIDQHLWPHVEKWFSTQVISLLPKGEPHLGLGSMRQFLNDAINTAAGGFAAASLERFSTYSSLLLSVRSESNSSAKTDPHAGAAAAGGGGNSTRARAGRRQSGGSAHKAPSSSSSSSNPQSVITEATPTPTRRSARATETTTESAPATPSSVQSKRSSCGHCHQTGHNKTTCPELKSPVTAANTAAQPEQQETALEMPALFPSLIDASAEESDAPFAASFHQLYPTKKVKPHIRQKQIQQFWSTLHLDDPAIASYIHAMSETIVEAKPLCQKLSTKWRQRVAYRVAPSKRHEWINNDHQRPKPSARASTSAPLPPASSLPPPMSEPSPVTPPPPSRARRGAMRAANAISPAADPSAAESDVDADAGVGANMPAPAAVTPTSRRSRQPTTVTPAATAGPTAPAAPAASQESANFAQMLLAMQQQQQRQQQQQQQRDAMMQQQFQQQQQLMAEGFKAIAAAVTTPGAAPAAALPVSAAAPSAPSPTAAAPTPSRKKRAAAPTAQTADDAGQSELEPEIDITAPSPKKQRTSTAVVPATASVTRMASAFSDSEPSFSAAQVQFLLNQPQLQQHQPFYQQQYPLQHHSSQQFPLQQAPRMQMPGLMPHWAPTFAMQGADNDHDVMETVASQFLFHSQQQTAMLSQLLHGTGRGPRGGRSRR